MMEIISEEIFLPIVDNNICNEMADTSLWQRNSQVQVRMKQALAPSSTPPQPYNICAASHQCTSFSTSSPLKDTTTTATPQPTLPLRQQLIASPQIILPAFISYPPPLSSHLCVPVSNGNFSGVRDVLRTPSANGTTGASDEEAPSLGLRTGNISNTRMLSTAMNFLAEKRKKFQRSDTAPTLGLGGGFNHSPSTSPSPSPEPPKTPSPSNFATTRNLGIMDLAVMTTSMITVPTSTSIDGLGVSPPRLGVVKSPPRTHKSPEQLRAAKDHRSMEDIASRRAHSVDFGRRIKVSPKAMRNSPSVPSKLNRHTFVKRLTRYNSARSMEELKREFGRNEKVIRDANDLFSAIDRNDYNQVEQILSRRPVLVNTYNDLQLSPLDMALLLKSNNIAELIINHGGFNNPRFSSPAKMQTHLTSLSIDLAKRIIEMSLHVTNSVLGAKDFSRELGIMENTHNLVKRLNKNLNDMLVPCPVNKAVLEVFSISSILVIITPPSDSTVLKYKIEWSFDEKFVNTDLTMLVDAQYPIGYYEILDLSPGVRYFVRVSAMNLKGWSCQRLTQPRSCVPSSWNEVVQMPDRAFTFSAELGEIKSNVDQTLCFWLTSSACDKIKNKSPLSQRKKSLKNLFAPSYKFVRHAKKGVYLALVCQCEDKIVLFEDLLPLLPTDDTCPTTSSLVSDSLWLARLIADFQDLKLLSQNIERLSIPTSLELRIKLLYAAQQFQTALGTSDIGKIYPDVFIGSGVGIIVVVKSVEDFREVSLSGGLRWSSITSKLSKKTGKEDGSSGEGTQTQLVSPEEEMYSHMDEYQSFSNRSGIPVSAGLYLCYLRLKCNVGQLEIQHPQLRCNMPPAVKIRENPHVSKEEWTYLKALSAIEDNLETTSLPPQGQSCESFHNDIVTSWHRLREQLRLKPSDIESTRLYLNEVVSFSPDVSVIFVLPSPDKVCSAPGAPFSLPLDFRCMSLNAFEIFLFLTYEPEFFARYATLSATLDLLSPVAQQVLRQSFHDQEITQCRRRVEIFTNAQSRLEEMWKLKRWSADVINTAREKSKSSLRAMPIAQLEPINEAYKSRQLLRSQQVIKPTFLLTDSSSYASSGGDSGTGSADTSMKSPERSSSQPEDLNKSFTTTTSSNAKATASSVLTRILRGTLRVFSGYPSGLPEGTSVRLLVNSQTTAREIIDLVVRRLNQTALLKNPNFPVYTESQLPTFSLTVSIGIMERPLPEAFHPLLLQAPWKKGKLIIRQSVEDNDNSECVDIADSNELATDV